MNSFHKPPSVHKHLHYHYHYDVNDRCPIETQTFDKYSQNSTLTPQQSHIFTGRTSWKHHINPQIARLYQEISLNESLHQAFSPKASKSSHLQMRQWQNGPMQAAQKQLSQSRFQLLQRDLKEYQTYLKERSGSNLYIPKTKSLIKFENQNKYVENPQKFISRQEIIQDYGNRPKSLQEILMLKNDSKIFSSKNCEKTTTLQENQVLRQSQLKIDFGQNKQRKNMNSVGYSQIKSPQVNQPVVDRAKIRMSHIQNNSQRFEEQQNSNFSLFQRQAKRQSLKQSIKQHSSDHFQQQLQNQYNSDPQLHIRQEFRPNDQQHVSNYKYELIQEECQFLRDKFIQHIQKKHNLKF